MTFAPIPLLLASRTGRSAYFEASRRHGPRLYTVLHRRVLPALYGDPEEEYWALRTGVVLWDVGSEIPIEVSGPDALDFINWATTRDFTKCPVGGSRYTFLVDEHGGVVNDPVVLRLDEDRFWLMPSDSDLLLWLKALACAARYRVSVVPVNTAPLQVRGPKAKDVMRELFGEQILDLGYYRWTRAAIDGIEVIVSRTGFAGELGYELMPLGVSRVGEAFWKRVYEAGRSYGIRVTGPSQIRRIEAGIFLYGLEITLDTNPFELSGYQWMVNLRKPVAFVGREALERIAAEGPRRRLVGVEIAGESLGSYNDGSMPEPFLVVEPGSDQVVGKVTSACYSPALRKNIGFALLPVEHAREGTVLAVLTPAGPRQAQVVPKPFLDPEKQLPRQ